MIETFKAPKEFYVNGEKPTFRVFRDREELAARDLGDGEILVAVLGESGFVHVGAAGLL